MLASCTGFSAVSPSACSARMNVVDRTPAWENTFLTLQPTFVVEDWAKARPLMAEFLDKTRTQRGAMGCIIMLAAVGVWVLFERTDDVALRDRIDRRYRDIDVFEGKAAQRKRPLGCPLLTRTAHYDRQTYRHHR